MTDSFFSLPADAARELVTAIGGRAFHAAVIRREVFERGVLSYAEMTSLPKGVRERLESELPLLSSREIDRVVAPDGTTKLLLSLADGATIETVHMPSRRPGKGATLCVSTQVGCPVGCPFCASGRAGLERNLLAHEILEQYLHGRSIGPVSRSVVMGIGEPLLNATNLLAALAVVNGELGIGARKITVSTVGFPERLRRLAPERPPFQLAISLHTPDDAQRAELVPAMAGVPVEDVLTAGDDWFAATGREVTYEYCLLGGTNDSPSHARRLADRLKGRRCTVNLIPYNPIEAGLPGQLSALSYRRPSGEAAELFRSELEENGVVATVRWSRGVATDAACGQLRIRHSRTE